jgi:hypothetical protein
MAAPIRHWTAHLTGQPSRSCNARISCVWVSAVVHPVRG